MAEHLILFLFQLARTFLGKSFRKLRRKARSRFKDHWLEVPARIEVVSVAHLPEPAEFIKTYVASLTYFYRNPDLHTGDYQIEFDTEWEAQVWVKQFKGCHVKVRVNPRDLDDSVLLQLPAVYRPVPQPPRPAAPTKIRPPKPVKIRALSPGQKVWAENCRLISVAGLGASLAILVMNIALGAHARSPALFGLGAFLMAFVLVSLGVLSRRAIAQGSLRAAPRFFAFWCPRRIKNILFFSGLMLMMLFLCSIDRKDIAAETRAILGAHIPYVAAAWIFLVGWAFHNAILQSQQTLAVHHKSYQSVT